MKNKRAQSEVITTVLIILLVIAAVFIVYTAVRGMVTSSTGTAENKAKCIGLTLSVTGVTNSVAAVVGPPAIPAVPATVSITRLAGGDAGAITPVILVKGVQRTATCVKNSLIELESNVCTLGTDAADTVTAAADIAVGGKFGDIVCEGTFKKAA